jgi:hypothetical protein
MKVKKTEPIVSTGDFTPAHLAPTTLIISTPEAT